MESKIAQKVSQRAPKRVLKRALEAKEGPRPSQRPPDCHFGMILGWCLKMFWYLFPMIYCVLFVFIFDIFSSIVMLLLLSFFVVLVPFVIFSVSFSVPFLCSVPFPFYFLVFLVILYVLSILFVMFSLCFLRYHWVDKGRQRVGKFMFGSLPLFLSSSFWLYYMCCVCVFMLYVLYVSCDFIG